MLRKKLAAILLTLTLLVPALSLAEEISYSAGDTVQCVFTVLANPNKAIGATLKLEYDHGALELIPSAYVQNDAPIVNMNLRGIPEGETVEASFRVLPAASGVYEIAIKVEQAGDIDENEVEGLLFSTCSVTVGNLADELAAARAELEQLRAQAQESQQQIDALTAEVERLRSGASDAPEEYAPEEDFKFTIVTAGAQQVARITRYTGNASRLVIPPTLGGCPVTRIPISCFAGCESLVEVVIPDTVTEIKTKAFYQCYSLQSVEIPQSVTQISANAFADCGSDLVLFVNNGSYAMQYCQENNIRYQAY